MSSETVDAAAEPAAPAVAALRPLRSRYLLAVLLVAVALVSAVSWGLVTLAGVDATADSFARTDVPGEFSVDVHPGSWDLYAEGGADLDGIVITDERGDDVAVGPATSSAYERDGRTVEPVGSFEVPLGGEFTYRIGVTGTGDAGETPTLAVGPRDDVESFTRQRPLVLVLLAVNVGAAVAIVVVPVVRWRRNRA